MLTVTAEVVLSVVLLSVAFGVPAAYALARRDFAAKRLVLLLFLLPLMVPPITYGIPLATVMYKLGLAGTLPGVILANLINVRIAKAGLVVHEVPSYERDRIYGASNLSAMRDGSRVLRTIARERVSAAARRPWRSRSRWPR